MSSAPLSCNSCSVERRFERIGRFPGGGEAVFAVAWRCPSCNSAALDVCPVGPVVPTEPSCLSCGEEHPSATEESVCPGCGMRRAEAMSFLGLDGDLPAEPLTAVLRLFEAGLHRRGLGLLNLVLLRDPGNAEAWRQKAVFLHSLGFHAASLEPLRRAIAGGAAPELRVSLGFALQELGRFDEAVTEYEEFVARHPYSPWLGVALCNQANALVRLGKDDEAEERFRAALRAEPSRTTHTTNYHLLLSRQHRWQDALDNLEQGLSHGPTGASRVSLLLEKAWGLAELERGQASLDAVDETLSLDPENARAHYLRGRALGLLGRLEEARAEMRRVLTAQPDHADAQRALGMLDEALGATHKQRPWWKPWS